MKRQRIALLCLLALNFCYVSAQKWYTPDIDKKIEELLKQTRNFNNTNLYRS